MPGNEHDIQQAGQRRRAEWGERAKAKHEPRPTVGSDGREVPPQNDFRNSIWMRRRESGQRGQPSLSYEAIVDTAIELADAEGPKAITMRGIATRLGVGTMSLYWYVPSKHDLLDLVIDAVQGEIDIPDPGTGDWREDMTVVARNTRHVMLQHHWMVHFIGSGPPIGPHALRQVDLTLSYFTNAGIDIHTALSGAMTVGTFVLGYVLQEQKEVATEEQQSPLRETADETRSAFEEYLAGYPHIQAMVRAGIDPDARETRDARFEFGLQCVLDGIAARIEVERGGA